MTPLPLGIMFIPHGLPSYVALPLVVLVMLAGLAFSDWLADKFGPPEQQTRSNAVSDA